MREEQEGKAFPKRSEVWFGSRGEAYDQRRAYYAVYDSPDAQVATVFNVYMVCRVSDLIDDRESEEEE